ncbi:MAG TPA: twin-arginine translocase TatA/TatE family subunit [Solirubrobacteraceae bacterium]
MLGGILQPTHVFIVLIVVLLVLGPKRLPEAGRAIGQGLSEFKGSFRGAHDDPEDQIEWDPTWLRAPLNSNRTTCREAKAR